MYLALIDPAALNIHLSYDVALELCLTFANRYRLDHCQVQPHLLNRGLGVLDYVLLQSPKASTTYEADTFEWFRSLAYSLRSVIDLEILAQSDYRDAPG